MPVREAAVASFARVCLQQSGPSFSQSTRQWRQCPTRFEPWRPCLAACLPPAVFPPVGRRLGPFAVLAAGSGPVGGDRPAAPMTRFRPGWRCSIRRCRGFRIRAAAMAQRAGADRGGRARYLPAYLPQPACEFVVRALMWTTPDGRRTSYHLENADREIWQASSLGRGRRARPADRGRSGRRDPVARHGMANWPRRRLDGPAPMRRSASGACSCRNPVQGNRTTARGCVGLPAATIIVFGRVRW